MADGLVLNFGAQRNEDYLRVWKLRPQGASAGIDITDWVVVLRINSVAGLSGSPLLTVSQTPTVNGSVISMADATDGQISVFIAKEDTAALPGRTQDIVPFAYNLLATDDSGVTRANVRGLYIVEPGT